MSFRVGTPNYGLPQTEGTDKRDWSDTNQPFLAIDTAIKTAVDTSASASSAASTAQQTADGANTAAAHAQTDATTAQTLATSASELATTAKNRADSAYTNVGDLDTLKTSDKTSAVAAINEVRTGIAGGNGSVKVTANGTETNAQLFTRLDALVDWSKVTMSSYMLLNDVGIFRRNNNNKDFCWVNYDSITAIGYGMTKRVKIQFNNNGTLTYTDTSEDVPSNGTTYELFY